MADRERNNSIHEHPLIDELRSSTQEAKTPPMRMLITVFLGVVASLVAIPLHAATLTISSLESAVLNPYDPNTNSPANGFGLVRERFNPQDDAVTLVKFDLSTLHLHQNGIVVTDARFKVHHSGTEDNTPANYVAPMNVLTIGYYAPYPTGGGSFGLAEAAVDGWNQFTVTPSNYPGTGYWDFNPTNSVLDLALGAQDYSTFETTSNLVPYLVEWLNDDTNGVATLVMQGGGTPDNYPFDWRSFYFDHFELQVTTNAVPEPSSLLLATTAACTGLCFARRRLRRASLSLPSARERY